MPGAITPMAPLRTGSPGLMVCTSIGRKIGTAQAIASRSLIRCTELGFRFSAWARAVSSITQGKLVVFTRPPITGPAIAKQARPTRVPDFARNSFTIASKLGYSAQWNCASATGEWGPASLEKSAKCGLRPSDVSSD